MSSKAEVLVKIQEIESELKRIGRWQSEPLDNEKFENMGAFGRNTLTPEQWIQFVLISSVRETANSSESFPSSSQVAVWAFRNFDGDVEAEKLCSLLAEFDSLFN